MLSILSKVDEGHYNVYSSDSKMYDVMSEDEIKDYLKQVGRVDGARISWGKLKIDFRCVDATFDSDKCFYCGDYELYTAINKSLTSKLYIERKNNAIVEVENYIKPYRTYEQLYSACNGSVILEYCTLKCENNKVIFYTKG